MAILSKGALTRLFGWRGPPTQWNYARQEKEMDITLFFYFFLRHTQNSKDFFLQNCINFNWICLFLLQKVTFQFFFFLRPESKCKFLFVFFFLRRGTKHPCRSSSTKQYSESCLIEQHNVWNWFHFLTRKYSLSEYLITNQYI